MNIKGMGTYYRKRKCVKKILNQMKKIKMNYFANKNGQTYILIIGLMVNVLIYPHLIYAAIDAHVPNRGAANNKGTSHVQYVSDEIIVKFKKSASDALENKITQKGKSLGLVKLAPSLDNLNKKYNVKKITPIFKNFKKNRERLEALKQKEESLLTEQEKHLLRRLQRAPKDAKIPALDRIYILTLKEGQSVEAAVAEYKQDDNVEYAQPNYIYEIYETPLPGVTPIPNDYYIEDDQNLGFWRQGSWGQGYLDLWGLQKTQALEAYALFYTNENGVFDIDEKKPGEGVIVAVLDTGVDYNHEDLAANIWINSGEDLNNNGVVDAGDFNGIDDDDNGETDDIRGYDFSDDDNDPIDYHGHGSHCSGTIAAMGNNNVGVAGVAPYATIMPVKIFPNATTENIIQAILYAADNGADVLSNSWGPAGRSPSDPTLEAAIDVAYAQGCVIVFAAGNNNDDVAFYSPANYSKTIAVAATDYQDEKASFSNWGDLIDVAAPGVDILSLRATGTDMYGDGQHIVDTNYYFASGTSMACPHVAGLAALLLSTAPFSSDEIRQIIRDTADGIDSVNPDYAGLLGTGRINAHQVVLRMPGPDGRIFLDNSIYPAPTDVVITVLDTDLNLNSAINDTVSVEIYSSTEPDPEHVVLTEREPDAGIFQGAISIDTGSIISANDGILQVEHNDTITATYVEISPPGDREATALVDIQAPVISAVQAALDILIGGEGVATVSWQTDEPSTSVIYYTSIPPLRSTIILSDYVMEHDVEISGLESETTYYFAVGSTDIVGNVAYDDNGEGWYNFIILPPEIDVSPAGFTFTEVLEGSEPLPPQTITVSNIAEQQNVDLFFKIPLPSQAWLSALSGEGRIGSGTSMDVQFTVNPRFLEAGNHTGEIIIHNNTLSSPQTVIPVTLTALPAPTVRCQRYNIIDDWSGRSFLVNGDGRFNPGERIELQVEVKNRGSISATGVFATLSLAAGDPYVTILDNQINFENITSDATVVSPNNFLIEALDTTPDNHTVTFALDITDSEGHLWHKEFPINIITPFLGPRVPDTRLDTDVPKVSNSYNAQTSSDNNGHVYVVWQDDRYQPDQNFSNLVEPQIHPHTHGNEIYFNYSMDYGATWQKNDIRLTSYEPGLTISGSPQISCDDNGRVYVVWSDERNSDTEFGPSDIYFNYSTDYGATWLQDSGQSEIRLNTDAPGSAFSWTPLISHDNNGNVYVVWIDYRNGNSDIYFNYSADYGATWQGNDKRLDTDAPTTGYSINPQISYNDAGHVYVVWEDNRNGRWDVYLNYSTDYGATWLQDDGKMEVQINQGLPTEFTGRYPQISSDDSGHVYVVWFDDRFVQYDIFFNYSTDYGATWLQDYEQDDIRLDTDTPGNAFSNYPQISSDTNGHVYVAWSDFRNGGGANVYFNYSTDFGATWRQDYGQSDIRIDTQPTGTKFSTDPQISSDSDGNVYVIWEDERDGFTDVYFNYSTDFGATWRQDYGQLDIRLDTDAPGAARSRYPQISSDNNGNAYVVWEDIRNGWVEVYFVPIVIADVPSINPVADQEIKEGSLLEFSGIATNPAGTELELFFDPQELSVQRQNNLSSAIFNTSFNEAIWETTGIFHWTPQIGMAGVYDPVVFVARNEVGRCSYESISITVTTPVTFTDDDFGPGTPGWGVTHFDSVQDGIDVVQNGGTVYVANGMYLENILIDKPVYVEGSGWDVTTIDGDVRILDGSVFASGTDRAMLAHFRINRGIDVIDAEPLIAFNKIDTTFVESGIEIIRTMNHALDPLSPVIHHNIIAHNFNGIYMFYDSSVGSEVGKSKTERPMILNNTLYGNATGIVYASDKEVPEVRNNIIDGNDNQNIGGDDKGILILYENDAGNLSIPLLAERLDQIKYNDVVNYAFRGWLAEDTPKEIVGFDVSNIEADPLFVGELDGEAIGAIFDYHLQSSIDYFSDLSGGYVGDNIDPLAVDSPGIDTGMPPMLILEIGELEFDMVGSTHVLTADLRDTVVVDAIRHVEVGDEVIAMVESVTGMPIEYFYSVSDLSDAENRITLSNEDDPAKYGSIPLWPGLEGGYILIQPTDFAPETYFHGNRINMGAYGGTDESALSSQE